MENNNLNKKQMGHDFLASLGKKRLRPGGLEGTNFLIDYISKHFKNPSEITILEISCNQGTTLIDLAKKLKCKVVGIDINKEALEKAKNNIKINNLEKQVSVTFMNAASLNFENNSFDVVINEAMLTMYKDKSVFLKEYYRVLKPNGILLTHDISIKDIDNDTISESLKETINLKPYPLSKEQWLMLMKENQFSTLSSKEGKFSLLTLKGLLRDEGFVNMVRIFFRANKKENRKQFVTMRKYFTKNKKYMNYIAMVNQK